MKVINTVLFSCIVMFFLGCLNANKQRPYSLLPENIKLKLETEKEIGITNFYIYQLQGNIISDSLSIFPRVTNSEDEKKVVHWHTINSSEFKDIKHFVNSEQADNEIAVQLLNNLSNNKEYLIALIYDKDRKPIGTKGYSIYDWIELYFLDLENKKITHISYGKF